MSLQLNVAAINCRPTHRKPCPHCRRKSETVAQKSATVAENGQTTAKFGDRDCRTFLRQYGQGLLNTSFTSRTGQPHTTVQSCYDLLKSITTTITLFHQLTSCT